ncbi:MAG: penicillin-binding protein 2 [Thermoleophilaceae bacterium]
MNRQIVQLFGLTLVLFAVLIAFTSRWTVFEAASLRDQVLNKRPLLEQQQVPRGLIVSGDARGVLARSTPDGRGPQRVYERSYPAGDLFAHAVGYSYIERGMTGIEQSQDDALTGDLNEFGTIFRELQGGQREGDDVVTTLHADAQRTAYDALAGRRGAIVALEPATGRIRVMASSPSYDPNRVPDDSYFESLRTDEDARPLVNRTTQTAYPPGSTFKVVTAAAALDSRALTPDSIVDGSSPATISGVPLSNAGNVDWGPISFTTALTGSVNTVFARVGEQVGSDTLLEYMDRFGFGHDPQLDYPDGQMTASGVRDADQQLVEGGFDVGRVAIGQGGAEGQIQATPLQMALVAAAVGNRGQLMRPRLVERVVGKDGRVEEQIEPALQSQVMKPESADQLARMMADVVNEGTGTAAALSDVAVAGKTGTAEVAGGDLNQVWFIGFAPVESPRYAIAVTLEDQPIGTSGGADAAPLAAQVLQTLLSEGG